jgi:hypothetical protein
MRITYSLRLLVAPLNIDKYNDNVNNTKEYKYMSFKECFLCNLRYIGILTACWANS